MKKSLMFCYTIIMVWLCFGIISCAEGNEGDCPIGAEGCACTNGGSCDPGLSCEAGKCVTEGGGDGDTDGDSDGDSDGDTDSDSDTDTVSLETDTWETDNPVDTGDAVCDEPSGRSIDAHESIAAVLEDPSYTGCSETGINREPSQECTAMPEELRMQLVHLGYSADMQWGYCCNYPHFSIRQDADTASLLAEAQAAADGFECIGDHCTDCGLDSGGCARPDYQPWCAENRCAMQYVCTCSDGSLIELTDVCNGVSDCPDGEDETC